MSEVIIKPQPGFQEKFLTSPADIAIGGGAAGAGKTFAELLEPLYHVNNKNFGAEIFRRTTPQIKTTGGLWDESQKIYNAFGAKSNSTELKWTFPAGSHVKFSSLQYEDDVYGYQSSSIPLICFDELTHFSEKMFWYMLSRNRSTCGVKPYMRATCNPDPDSFVAKLIEWWIDQDTGFPIEERSGKLRYFWRSNESLFWADSKEEIYELKKAEIDMVAGLANCDPMDLIKSLTFIPGKIYENLELMKKDPSYLANLMAQDDDTRSRLLDGNWKIRQDKSSLFDFAKINDIFSNYIAQGVNRYITCDAARFGRDLCVIMVWKGWEVIGGTVLKKSDVHDIIKEVELLRAKFGIGKSNTLIDQDGVGAATVRQGGYKGFSGGDIARKVMGGKENYKNLKTQCYYMAAEKVNNNDILIQVNAQNWKVDGIIGSKIKIGSKVFDIQELIRDDLRAVKRDKMDMEGKFCIVGKDEQKIILGRSPDFGDTIMMRSFFDLVPKSQYL